MPWTWIGSEVSDNHYYPFGLQMQGLGQEGNPDHKFTYNGKEEQTDFDLNWHDYGARMYDVQIGRFTSIDPLAEMYQRNTPYHYVLNNPLKFVDPTGMKVEETESGFKYTGKDAQEAFRAIQTYFASSGGNDEDNNNIDDDEQSDPVPHPEIAPTGAGKQGGLFGLKRYNGTKYHDGIDIKASKGTMISSVLSGRVVWVEDGFMPGQYKRDSFGNYVIVETTDSKGNRIQILYGHLDAVTVSVGDEVQSGWYIGLAGNTGNAGYKKSKNPLLPAWYDGASPGIAESRFHVHVRAKMLLNGSSLWLDADPTMFTKTKFTTEGKATQRMSGGSLRLQRSTETYRNKTRMFLFKK